MSNVVGFRAFDETALGAALLAIGRDSVDADRFDHATSCDLIDERLALAYWLGNGAPWRFRLTKLGLAALTAIELKLELDGADPE